MAVATTAYIRDMNGNTLTLPLQDAINHFLSEEGYRITIVLQDNTELILRRDSELPVEVSTFLNERSANHVRVTIRR
jgi:hypothetical protein